MQENQSVNVSVTIDNSELPIDTGRPIFILIPSLVILTLAILLIFIRKRHHDPSKTLPTTRT